MPSPFSFPRITLLPLHLFLAPLLLRFFRSGSTWERTVMSSPFCVTAHNSAPPTYSSYLSGVSVVSQRTRITAISFVYARTISHDYSQFSSVRRENKLVR